MKWVVVVPGWTAAAMLAGFVGALAAATFHATALAQSPVLWTPDLYGVASYRDARYRGTIGQLDWHTCGAAAVATWLSFYLGRPASEAEVWRVAALASAERGQSVENGLSLLALKEALESYGVHTQGYRIQPERLLEYFNAGGLPLLVHVTRPRLHYMLAVGVQDGYLILSDPSYGRRLITLSALVAEKGFEGVVLAALLDQETAASAAAAQQDELAAVRAHLSRMARLREVLMP